MLWGFVWQDAFRPIQIWEVKLALSASSQTEESTTTQSLPQADQHICTGGPEVKHSTCCARCAPVGAILICLKAWM